MIDKVIDYRDRIVQVAKLLKLFVIPYICRAITLALVSRGFQRFVQNSTSLKFDASLYSTSK
jgi:hypothetical protein